MKPLEPTILKIYPRIMDALLLNPGGYTLKEGFPHTFNLRLDTRNDDTVILKAKDSDTASSMLKTLEKVGIDFEYIRVENGYVLHLSNKHKKTYYFLKMNGLELDDVVAFFQGLLLASFNGDTFIISPLYTTSGVSLSSQDNKQLKSMVKILKSQKKYRFVCTEVKSNLFILSMEIPKRRKK